MGLSGEEKEYIKLVIKEAHESRISVLENSVTRLWWFVGAIAIAVGVKYAVSFFGG